MAPPAPRRSAIRRAAAATVLLLAWPLTTTADAAVPERAAAPGAASSSSPKPADVLFWSRSSPSAGPVWGHSVVTASAATPALAATVLAGSVSQDNWADYSGPDVSPDGSKLAYVKVSLQGGQHTTLAVRDLATGATTVLFSEADVDGHYYALREPTWSPDGQRIAFVREVIDTSSTQVRTVSAAGGPGTIVQDRAVAAAWRPDGTLTVARLGPGAATTSGLWVTGATPADAVRIPGSSGARDHAWSPDGSSVVFSRFAPAVNPSIATLPAKGGTPDVLVPPDSAKYDLAPAWSGDGQRIYFTQGRPSASGDASSQILGVARTGGAVEAVAASDGKNTSVSVSTTATAPVPSRSHDFSADGYADVLAAMPNGDLRLYYGDGLRLSGSTVIGTGWAGSTAIFSSGDFDGDGHPDVIGNMPNGDLRLFTGLAGGPKGSRLIGTGWNGLTVFSPGDFDGDGHPDVIGRMPNGDLRLFTGLAGGPAGSKLIGTGWNGLTVFSPGDFDGDGHPDVIARMSNGDLRLYFGTGVTLSGWVVIGTGWNGLSALFSPGDFNLDGRPDVIGRLPNGDLRVYYGNGARLSGNRTIGTGWSGVGIVG
ncbi:MAG: FG-GAP-like repeat-containing protein [Mycobacteriales bacterium]